MQGGDLDRRVQFRRAALVDDGFAKTEAWGDHGSLVWASRRDMTDIEKQRADQTIAASSARFSVRYSVFTSGITPKDRLVCEGKDYGIIGIRELGRREWLEITATARVDQ